MTKRIAADINVTPLIDILLVMLVIFLAALPLTQQGLDTTVPQNNQTAPPEHSDQIVAEYSADHRLTINKQPVAVGDFEAVLRPIFATRRDKTLYLIGDGTVRYGEIARLVGLAKGAGVERVGIVTEGMRAGR